MQGIGEDERTVKIDCERYLSQWAVLVEAATRAAQRTDPLDRSDPSPVHIVNQLPARTERPRRGGLPLNLPLRDGIHHHQRGHVDDTAHRG